MEVQMAPIDTLFLAQSMRDLRQDDIVNRIVGLKLLTDNDESNNLLGAGLLTNDKAAVIAGVLNR